MYSNWAQRRRSRIIFWVSAISFTALATYVLIRAYEPPSCFDRTLNQDELGIDCGGSCELLCTSQVKPLRTVWSRSFKVSEGLWSALAYIENPNPNTYVTEAKYRFVLYNKENEIITERRGSTFISQGTVLPVFEKRIYTKGVEPYRTEFEWTDHLRWHRNNDLYDVAFIEQKLFNIATKPELTATLKNNTPYYLEDIDVVAIVYDSGDNAMAVSKTFVDSVPLRGERNITFSWSKSFYSQPERWEIIAKIPKQED